MVLCSASLVSWQLACRSTGWLGYTEGWLICLRVAKLDGECFEACSCGALKLSGEVVTVMRELRERGGLDSSCSMLMRSGFDLYAYLFSFEMLTALTIV